MGASTSPAVEKPSLLARIMAYGPGLSSAAITIGPGSLTLASLIGSKYGYQMGWVVAVAVVVKVCFNLISHTVTVVSGEHLFDATRKMYGSFLTIIGGITGALTAACFLTGNFIGSGLAFTLIIPANVDARVYGVLMAAFAIFLVHRRQMFKTFESTLSLTVALMLIAFGFAFVVSNPSIGGMARSFVPGFPDVASRLTALSVVASSTSLAGCAFIGYMGKAKSWTTADLDNRIPLKDSLVSGITTAVITLLMIFVAAATLNPRGIIVNSGQALAQQLDIALFQGARYIMAVGLWAASFSSLVGAASMGATLLLASLGKPYSFESSHSRWTSTALIVLAAVMGSIFGAQPILLVILANAASFISAPVLGFLIVSVALSDKVLGARRYRGFGKALAIACYVVLLILAWNSLRSLSTSIAQLFQ